MKKYILLLSFVLILFFVYFLNVYESNKSKIKFIEKRKYLKSLNIIDSIPVNFGAYGLNVFEDTIYLYDYNNGIIKQLNKNGVAIEKFGGKGGSPNEFSHLSNYTIINDTLYVTDVGKNSISKLSKKGDVFLYYKFPKRINNALHLRNNSFLISTVDKNDFLNFKKFNLKTKINSNLKGISDYFPKINENWWVYDGKLLSNKNDFFYITFFSNELIKFNNKGRVIFHKKNIHNTPLLKLKQIENMIIPSENSSPSILDAELYGNYIYLLSNVSDDKERYKNNKHRVIDVYDTEKGQYLYSIKLINSKDGSSPIEIYFSKNKLFVLYEDVIIIYKFIT